ncbi:MAG: HD domain-containing protein, partial [Acidimicrobiales bacterium]
MAAPALSLATARHLVGRFLTSLWPGGPSAADEAWVASVLNPGQADLWRRMSRPDRRHAAGVARRVVGALGHDVERPVVAAALLHDVGKIESGLGTLGRVVATVAGLAGRRGHTGPRIARYLDHGPIGARLLTEAGSHPLVVAWAGEHHLPAERWSVPPATG